MNVKVPLPGGTCGGHGFTDSYSQGITPAAHSCGAGAGLCSDLQITTAYSYIVIAFRSFLFQHASLNPFVSSFSFRSYTHGAVLLKMFRLILADKLYYLIVFALFALLCTECVK